MYNDIHTCMLILTVSGNAQNFKNNNRNYVPAGIVRLSIFELINKWAL